jgi:hypothetical protein
MANLVKGQFQRFRNFVFLGDVLRLALTAFGGPQVHYTQFQRLLVQKKKYLSEDELKEILKLIEELVAILKSPEKLKVIIKKEAPDISLSIDEKIKWIENLVYEDFELSNYKSGASLSAIMK